MSRVIFFDLRLPRVLSAFFVGGLLSMSGLMMQVLLKNPLADPYILGVSAGAGLGGVLISLIVPATAFFWVQPLGTAGGACIVVLLVFGLALSRKRLSAESLLLLGVAVSSLCAALISLCLVIADPNHLRALMFWLLGELHGDRWLLLFCTWLFVFMALLPLAKTMNSAMFGDELAYSVGVNVRALQWQLYWLAALATSVAVAAGGMIGFVGLVIPHAMRLIWGTDHRVLLPACALFGGVFLVLSDLLARLVIAPEQLPIGVITALMGAPLFILLLLQHTQKATQNKYV